MGVSDTGVHPVIVVDTNLLVHLLLPGEHTEAARQTYLKSSHWVAPLLWRSEFRNVLARCIRQNQLSLPTAFALQETAEQLLKGREYAVQSSQVLEAAATSGCTAYDCEFVVLAQSLGAPLVTSDQQVLRAFPATTVSPQQFIRV